MGCQSPSGVGKLACNPSSGESGGLIKDAQESEEAGRVQVFPGDVSRRSPPHSLAGHNLFPQRRHLCLLDQPIRESRSPEPADQDAPVADESGVGKRTVLQITLHQLLTFTIATSHVHRNVSGQNAGMACCALRCVRSAPFDACCDGTTFVMMPVQ